MSHQLKQLTSNNKRISEVTESSFSSSQRSFKLQSQGVTNLQLHNNQQPSPITPTTKTTVEPLCHRLVDNVYCTCFGIWPKKFATNKNKQNSFDSTSSAMATTTANEQLRGPLDMGKKNYGGQRIKEELQREVSVLETMLSHEEKIREIMQQAYNRKPGMEFTLPNYLPPKMKEVLAELVMVEDEIARLETQIKKIQNDTKSEHEATQKLATKQLETVSSIRNASTSKAHNPHETNDDHQQQLPSYDNKALHFISKAINGGGYSLNDFTISNHNIGTQSAISTLGNSSSNLENRKESGINNDRVVVSKSSGMLKPSASPLRDFRHPPVSPSRDFRHPTPKPQERSSTEFRSDQPRKALSGLTKVEEISNGTKWQPNKLSENIMKTIILLYVRLIRTSRQIEMEKTGPVSRSLNFTAVSFRKEAGVSLSTSLVLNKESKQQDPYGVFDVEGAVTRDIGPYKNLVVFSSTSLDPKFVSHPSSISLFQKLRGLLSSLQKVELRSLTEQQKLAFWMNIYNACIMHGYLKFGVPSSPDRLINLLNKATLNVGGKIVNAQAIERCILRKPTLSTTKQVEMDTKEAIIYEQYGLKSVNSNVIFGLCYGTRSSPAVRIYTAEGVTSELEKSKLEYLLASISVTSSKKIWLPELLIENMVDFANDMDSLVHWVCQQLPTSGSLRKSIVDCFRGVASNSGRILSQPAHVEKLAFQFEFQYLLQV